MLPDPRKKNLKNGHCHGLGHGLAICCYLLLFVVASLLLIFSYLLLFVAVVGLHGCIPSLTVAENRAVSPSHRPPNTDRLTQSAAPGRATRSHGISGRVVGEPTSLLASRAGLCVSEWGGAIY